MNNQIHKYQQRLFNKLFATLPSVRKSVNFTKNIDIDLEINYFYYFNNKKFWFTKGETEDKYFYLFGRRNKSLKRITGEDTCLLIDFDKNIQFNDKCLGLFSIKNSEIHVLINYKILNKRYPYINTSDFKKNNIKSFDNSLEIETIDLGNLNDDFIENIENLIKESFLVKSQKRFDLDVDNSLLVRPQKDSNLNEDANLVKSQDSSNLDINNSDLVKLRGKEILKNNNDSQCKICHKDKSNFKIDDRLKNLEKLKPEYCGKCIEKIFVVEFYNKIMPLLKTNYTEELKSAKEKFGNDLLFDIGISLFEKYQIIRYIGVKELFFTINKDSYLIKKYADFSDRTNLLIDNITESKPKNNSNEDSIENISDSNNNTTKEQMEIVIAAIKDGKSRNEAAKLANIPPYKIVHWYNEGKIGNKPENIYFFKKMKEIEDNNKNNDEELQKRMDKVLNEIKKGKTFSQMDFISESTINEWINKGKQNKKPYVQFYNEYLKLKQSSVKIPKLVKMDSFGNRNTIMKMNIILENLAKGIGENEAILKANVSQNTYNYWLNRGKQKFGKLYIEFYNYVNQINHELCNDDELWEDAVELNNIDPDIYAPLPIEYEKSFSHTSMNQSGIAWVNQVGKKWVYAKSLDGKAIRITNEDIYQLHSEVKKAGHVWGVRDYDKARKFIDIPEDFVVPLTDVVGEDYVPAVIDPGIYAPLSDEFARNFTTQTNRTGLAWVAHAGNKWIYSRYIDENHIYIKADSVYELYDKVKDSGLDWGVRDYDVARKFIDIPEDFVVPLTDVVEEDYVPAVIDPGIYAPLSDEFARNFNSTQTNRTGLAWVNYGSGNKWIYSRSVGGEYVTINADSVYELYDKVKDSGLDWGVRDYDVARKFIDIPEDFVVPLTDVVEEDYVPVVIDPGIYAPLSDEFARNFNSQTSGTGLAWVYHSGKKWNYSRTVDEKHVYITAGSVYELYDKVKDSGLDWGVRDYDVVKKFIDIPKDYVVPKNVEEPVRISSGILDPLPEKYLKFLNTNQNRTGFAWVNPMGKKWVYQRKIDGISIKFSDGDIHKLHEVVIKNNHIWGVIDYDKAKSIINKNKLLESKQSKLPINDFKPIKSTNVMVNYIQMSLNGLDVIIKGNINNDELITTLSKLSLFEKDIKRIITNSIDNQIDIFIELEINKYLKNSFEEIINELGWKINK